MSVKYKAVSWNRQKRIYDGVMVAGILLAVMFFAVVTVLTQPNITSETIVLRTTAFTSFALLHIILVIGPLCRLEPRFLPLLYNRRHLGVTMFLLALVHAVFAVLQFHGFGVVNPIVSALTAYGQDFSAPRRLADLSNLPFEPFGFIALGCLFLMAATSHDFWLRQMGGLWKLLHLCVYVAYGSLLVHVTYGFLQDEHNPVYPAFMGLAFVLIVSLHVAAYRKERAIDRDRHELDREGYAVVCQASELRDGCGKSFRLGPERIALYMHRGRVFAVSGVCRHQGGPIAEGRILDGCITCPWHGWQYKPEDGESPPPFKEILKTYPVRVVGETVFVRESANPLGTLSEGAPANG